MSLSNQQTRVAVLLVTTFFCGLPITFANAGEAWTLTQGGKIQGATSKEKSPSLKNRSRTIAPTPTIVVTLAANTITHRKGVSPALEEYEATAHTYSDTVADQWKLVSWCQGKRLYEQRERHLRRIVELDPDDSFAWQALGYVPGHDGWMTRDEHQAREGYFWYRGKYRNNQEIARMKNSRREQAKILEAKKQQLRRDYDELSRKLLALRINIVDKKEVEASKKQLMELKGHAAVQVIWESMARETDAEMMDIWILAMDAIFDNDSDVFVIQDVRNRLCTLSLQPLGPAAFETLMRCLVKRQDYQTVAWYVTYLMDAQPKAEDFDVRFDQVCVVLRRLKSSLVNSILIESLIAAPGQVLMAEVVEDRDVLKSERELDSRTAQMIVGETLVSVQVGQNAREWPLLLHALESLNDISFGFNQKKWRDWNAKRTASTSISAR